MDWRSEVVAGGCASWMSLPHITTLGPPSSTRSCINALETPPQHNLGQHTPQHNLAQSNMAHLGLPVTPAHPPVLLCLSCRCTGPIT
jgi:hypothetical protein